MTDRIENYEAVLFQHALKPRFTKSSTSDAFEPRGSAMFRIRMTKYLRMNMKKFERFPQMRNVSQN